MRAEKELDVYCMQSFQLATCAKAESEYIAGWQHVSVRQSDHRLIN